VDADAVPGSGDGNAAPHDAASTLRSSAAAALHGLPPLPTTAAARPARAPSGIQCREQDRLGRRFASLDGRKLSPPLFRFQRRGSLSSHRTR